MTAVRKEFLQEAQDIRQQIRNGEVDSATRVLSLLSPESPSEKRLLLHLQARLEMKQDRFDAAKSLLEQASSGFDPHIDVLTDLASCYYMIGDVFRWRLSVMDLETRLNEQRSALSVDSRLRATLNLGKFLEELGEISRGFELYRNTLEEFRETMPVRMRIAFLAQRVRIQAQYGIREGLAEIYSQLMAIQNLPEGLALQEETQHALVVAEAELFGPGTALSRFKALLSSPGSTGRMQSLIFYDLLEVLSLRHPGSIDLIRSLRPDPMYRDPAEQVMDALMVEGRWDELSPARFGGLSKQISPACFLRLLHLAASLSAAGRKEFAWMDEIRAQALFILGGVSAPSRQLWSARFGSVFEKSQSEVLEIEIDKGLLRCEDRVLDVEKKRIMRSYLLCFSEGQKEVSLEALALALWGAVYNPTYYDRIRVLTARLNKELTLLTLSSRVFEFAEQSVKLKPRVEIRVRS